MDGQEIIDIMLQYGVPAAIALYLVKWVTTMLTDRMRELSDAIKMMAEALDKLSDKIDRMETVQELVMERLIRSCNNDVKRGAPGHVRGGSQ